MQVYLIQEPCDSFPFSNKQKAAIYIRYNYPNARMEMHEREDKLLSEMTANEIARIVNEEGFFQAYEGRESISIQRMEVV